MIILFRFLLSLVLGLVSTMAYANVLTKKNLPKIIGAGCSIFALEFLLIKHLGASIAFAFYPLHTHLVLWLFLVFLFGCKPRHGLFYVLLAYITCMPVGYFSKVTNYIWPESRLAEYSLYGMLTVLTLFLVIRYFAPFVSYVVNISDTMDFALIVVPALLYLFDYATTVWSDALFKDNYAILQFMPFVICIVYLCGLSLFNREVHRRMELLEEQSFMERELQLASGEIEELEKREEMSRIYRHDMRHHFAILQKMIQENQIPEAKRYILENIKGIEAISPRRFCEIEIVNLVLSRFEETVKKEQVEMVFDVDLPGSIPLNNTEICVLLSNLLEMAFSRLSQLPEEKRKLDLKLCIHADMLVFSVDYACNEVQTTSKESILQKETTIAIAREYGGQAYINGANGTQRVMVTIPLS